jgi:hypothetical protein
MTDIEATRPMRADIDPAIYEGIELGLADMDAEAGDSFADSVYMRAIHIQNELVRTEMVFDYIARLSLTDPTGAEQLLRDGSLERGVLGEDLADSLIAWAGAREAGQA